MAQGHRRQGNSRGEQRAAPRARAPERARAGPAERGPMRGSPAQGWPRPRPPPPGTHRETLRFFFPQKRALSDGQTELVLRAAQTALWSSLSGDQSMSCLPLGVLSVSHLDTSCLPLSPNLPRCSSVFLFVRKVTIVHKYTDQKVYPGFHLQERDLTVVRTTAM